MRLSSLFAAATLLAATSATAATALNPALPPLVRDAIAPRLGDAAPDLPMHLSISLPLRHLPLLDAALRSTYDPASPSFRHYLSVAQFTDRFGPTLQDYRQAAAFFAAQGLTVRADAPNHFLLQVDGRAADIERVFHVTIGLYQHPTENRTFYAPDREPSVDTTVPLLEIMGLDNAVLPYSRLAHAPAGAPAARVTGSGPGGYFIGSDIRTAYYPKGTLTGAGQSIGLMELAGFNVADVTLFFNSHYGAANTVPIVGVQTDSLGLGCGSGCDDSEQALDIEYAISMAPGLAQVQVYVGSSAEDVLNRMASDNTSKVLSTSWGWAKHFATDDALFKEFALQGQTNLTASGDYSTLLASGPWPEEDANITAVGGTNLTTKTPGGTYARETGWADSASGPSLDKTITIPAYQLPFITTANHGSTTLRNVSDIAAIAGFQLEICANGTCTGGYGGTSFASPIWAGFIALANQRAVALGKPVLGFLNPIVYKIAGNATLYPTAFHDPIHGKSGKYPCTPGYDLVTGVGTPKGFGTISALINP